MKKYDDDFEEIDLNEDYSDEGNSGDFDEDYLENISITPKKSGSSGKKGGSKKKKKKGFHVNLHMIFIGSILLVLVVVVVRLFIWNRGIIDDTPDVDTGEFDTEPMDAIVPLDSTNLDSTIDYGDLDILFLGNGSLSQDKDSEDNMANIIARKTGATVYNCSIADSYMSMQYPTYENEYPYDAFSFYNLCTVFTVNNTKTLDWAANDLGGELPADVKEATDLLQTIDYDSLDAICIFYDASDYLEQRLPYEDENSSNVQTFSGALEAGVKLIQEAHPNVRIIVMSPAYAYYEDENGNYISSFNEEIVEFSLYIYVIHEQDTAYLNNVSFVDNFYGSIYEEIADQYLEDNIHLNTAGRELLADRFIYALNRFSDYDFSAYEKKE